MGGIQPVRHRRVQVNNATEAKALIKDLLEENQDLKNQSIAQARRNTTLGKWIGEFQRALNHAVQKDHELNDWCDGCLLIQKVRKLKVKWEQS
jgi:hypothetical protein